jgi:hypothetical protein
MSVRGLTDNSKYILTFFAAIVSQGRLRPSPECESFEHFNPYEWDLEATDRSREYEKTREEGQEDHDDQDQENEEDEDMRLAEDALLIEDEYRMEPPLPPVETRVNLEHNEDLPQSSPTFRLRGGYEEGLKSDPFVVKFPGMAGNSHMVNQNADTVAAAETHQDNDPATNPFAPFLSKLDWEVARWAKLRGPGSTAFSELMGIESVSGAPLIAV